MSTRGTQPLQNKKGTAPGVGLESHRPGLVLQIARLDDRVSPRRGGICVLVRALSRLTKVVRHPRTGCPKQASAATAFPRTRISSKGRNRRGAKGL